MNRLNVADPVTPLCQKACAMVNSYRSVNSASEGLRAIISLFALARGTFTQGAEILEREDARVVAVAPDDLVAVDADRLEAQRLERRQLARFEDVKRVGRRAPLLATTGAGALAAQVLPGVHA